MIHYSQATNQWQNKSSSRLSFPPAWREHQSLHSSHTVPCLAWLSSCPHFPFWSIWRFILHGKSAPVPSTRNYAGRSLALALRTLPAARRWKCDMAVAVPGTVVAYLLSIELFTVPQTQPYFCNLSGNGFPVHCTCNCKATSHHRHTDVWLCHKD